MERLSKLPGRLQASHERLGPPLKIPAGIAIYVPFAGSMAPAQLVGDTLAVMGMTACKGRAVLVEFDHPEQEPAARRLVGWLRSKDYHLAVASINCGSLLGPDVGGEG